QEVAADARLAEYQPYWAARAALLAKTGAHAEARHAYEIAIGLERDASVRRFLQQRQSALSPCPPRAGDVCPTSGGRSETCPERSRGSSDIELLLPTVIPNGA